MLKNLSWRKVTFNFFILFCLWGSGFLHQQVSWNWIVFSAGFESQHEEHVAPLYCARALSLSSLCTQCLIGQGTWAQVFETVTFFQCAAKLLLKSPSTYFIMECNEVSRATGPRKNIRVASFRFSFFFFYYVNQTSLLCSFPVHPWVLLTSQVKDCKSGLPWRPFWSEVSRNLVMLRRKRINS